MRRTTHSARPLSILLVAFAIAFCATAALALPPKAEGAIHLGSPNTVSLSNGLVGYWPLDGATTNWATGQTNDLSGNGNTGALVGLATTTSPAIGKIGQALNFNGSTSVVDMGNVLHPTGAFTYSAWIYQTDYNPVGGGPTIMGRYTDSVPETWFGINSNFGRWLSLFVYTDASNYLDAQYSGILSLNTWYHVVATYDGGSTPSSIKIYLNGSRVDNNSDGGTFTSIPDLGTHFTIGASADLNYYFAGSTTYASTVARSPPPK